MTSRAYVHAQKFDDSSFSYPRHISGPVKFQSVSLDFGHDPFRDDLSLTGWNVISVCTKLEIPNFTGYEDMKVVAKCKNGMIWDG